MVERDVPRTGKEKDGRHLITFNSDNLFDYNSIYYDKLLAAASNWKSIKN